MKITGRLDGKLSWEKQTVFHLSNGWTAIIEFNNVLGIDFVRELYRDGQRWIACNGLGALPSFATGWLDYWHPEEHRGLYATKDRVAPQFEKVYLSA